MKTWIPSGNKTGGFLKHPLNLIPIFCGMMVAIIIYQHYQMKRMKAECDAIRAERDMLWKEIEKVDLELKEHIKFLRKAFPNVEKRAPIIED